MHIRNILLFSCFFFLFPFQINAQNAWDGKNLKGKLTFKSITTTRDFDADGNVSHKSEREVNYSSDQNIVLYGGRYQLLSKNEKQLDNFTQGNQNHILTGGDYEHGSLMKKSLNFPIEVSVDEKVWEKCDRDLILTRTSKGNGTIRNHNTSTYLNIIKTFSKKYVEEDKMMAEAMEKFHEQLMKERRAQDIKAGKVINEDDYFVPANLYQTHTYGLFLFTYSGQGYGGYTATGAKTKNRRFDCQFNKWVDDKDEDIRLFTNISNGSNGKLEKDYSEDGHIDYYRYVGIDPKEMEDFIKDPKDQTTFTGGSFEYHKSNGHESETKTIITLTVYLKDSEEKPGILFTGCENIVVGETATLSAAGKPSSGTYRYWSDGNAVSISGLDAQAKITANSSGKTTVWVEYTTPKGEKIKESKTIYSLKVNSINSGNPLQIGLYNVKGKPTNGIKPVSVAVEPAGEITKLTFKPADAAMVSAAPSGQNQLQVQGLKKGKTTVQAYSDCGTQTGPPLNVEILNCDDEVVKELRQQEKMLKSRLESNLKQVAELLGNKDFTEADENGPRAIYDVNKGLRDLLLLSSVKGAGANQQALKRIVGTLSDYESLAFHAGDKNSLLFKWQAINMKLPEGPAKTISSYIKTVLELADASDKLSSYLGTMLGVSDRLEELAIQFEKTQKEYLEVTRILYKICRRDGDPPVPEEKQKEDETAKPSKPTTPKKPLTASGEHDVNKEEKANEVLVPPKIETEPPGENPPPPQKDPEKINRGLLYNEENEDCNCDNSKSSEIKIGEEQTISQGILNSKASMKNIKDCFDDFNKTTLAPLAKELKFIEVFFTEVEAISILKKEDQEKRIGGLKVLLEDTKGEKVEQQFLKVSEFNKTSGGCPQKLQDDIISNLKINWNKLL